MERETREWWIDGLKLIACIGVFWHHFVLAFISLSEYGNSEVSEGIKIFLSVVNVFINGNFWVYIFCILSGYLASKKKIKSIREVLIEVVNRYIRFAIPFFFMAILIWLLSITIGFHSKAYGDILVNSWLAGFYTKEISLTDICKCIFMFDPILNRPMWMIQPLFCGSCVIYLYSYFTNNCKLVIKNVILLVMILSLLLVSKFADNTLYVASCILGALLPNIWKRIRKYNQVLCLGLFIMMLILLGGLHNKVLAFLCTFVFIPSEFFMNTFWNMFYAFGLLIFINNIKPIKMILADTKIRKISAVSFSVYILHWPLICSVSLLIYGFLSHRYSYSLSFVLNFISTNIVVGVSSIFYMLSFNKWSEKITIKIKQKLLSIISL